MGEIMSDMQREHHHKKVAQPLHMILHTGVTYGAL